MRIGWPNCLIGGLACHFFTESSFILWIRTWLVFLVLVHTVFIMAAIGRADDESLVAKGDFTAVVDFSTLTLSPVGYNCLLEVEGELIFAGTLEGTAPGKTRALVLATCGDVAVNPPGAFPDVFRSKLEFAGTVGGLPTVADVIYQGESEAGGRITGSIVLSNGLEVPLQVDAFIAVGGSYAGFIDTDEDDD